MTRFFFLLLLLAAMNHHKAFADGTTPQDTVPTGVKTRLGFDLGWEFPYSVGMELSVAIAEAVDINAGIGLGLPGFKSGLGCRFYPMRRATWSPMVGGYLFHTTGLGEVTITVNSDEALYRIPSANGYLINAGLRCRFKNEDYFMFAIGHSQAFKSNKGIYLEGSTDKDIQKVADVMGVGGFSLNLTYLFKMGR